MAEQEDTVTAKSAPVTDFFHTEDPLGDVAFTVEEKSILFNRALLMISSPVFARMFRADFQEKEQQKIPLPDKKFDEFMLFLRELHPAHSWMPLSDELLEPILKLADEYDVVYIKKKCSKFIGAQVDESSLTSDQEMRYLWLSDRFQLTEVQPDLLALACQHGTKDLETCQYFPMLHVSTQMQLMKQRCHHLEHEMAPDYQQAATIPSDQRPVAQYCAQFQNSLKIANTMGFVQAK